MHVTVLGVLRNTPLWVFPLFVYLLWSGLRRLRPSVRELRGIWITPGFFILWGGIGLLQRSLGMPPLLIWWGSSALLFFLLGNAVPIPLQADREHGLVRLPGSILPLLRILAIFGGHYALRVLAAVKPEQSAQYLNWDMAVSGAATGYFLGWSVRFWRTYLRSPPSCLKTAAAPA